MNLDFLSSIDIGQQDEIMSITLIIMKYICIITIPIYMEVIYCLVWHSPNFQKKYVVMISVNIILCMLTEIYGFQLTRPFIFIPVVGIYSDGILSMLGVHVFIQIIGYFFLFELNTAVMINIALFRLKIIIPVNYKYYDEVVLAGRIFVGCIYFCSIMAVCCFFFLYEDQYAAKFYLQQTIPTKFLPKVLWSDKYVVSTTKEVGFFIFMAICAGWIGFYGLMCITVPGISWYILHKTKHTLSPKVVEAQRSYLVTLLIQVVVMVSCVIIPFIVFYEGMRYEITNQVWFAASMIMGILNGAASTVTFLFGTTPYRRVMKRQLNHLFFRAGIVKERKYMSSTNAVSDIHK